MVLVRDKQQIIGTEQKTLKKTTRVCPTDFFFKMQKQIKGVGFNLSTNGAGANGHPQATNKSKAKHNLKFFIEKFT